MSVSIRVTLTDSQFKALRKFKNIEYYGGYYLVYKVKKGYNWEADVERELIKAFRKCARAARRRGR